LRGPPVAVDAVVHGRCISAVEALAGVLTRHPAQEALQRRSVNLREPEPAALGVAAVAVVAGRRRREAAAYLAEQAQEMQVCLRLVRCEATDADVEHGASLLGDVDELLR